MKRHAQAFSLVELLVVVGIIALLVSIMMPTFTKVMALAKETDCLNNLKTVSLALINYMNDESNQDRLPLNEPPNVTYPEVDANDLLPGLESSKRWWCNKVYPYGDRQHSIYLCPVDSGREGWAKVATSYGFNETLTNEGAKTLHAIEDQTLTALIGHCAADTDEPSIYVEMVLDLGKWPGLHISTYDTVARQSMGRCGFIMVGGQVETFTYGQAFTNREHIFYPKSPKIRRP